MSKDLYDKRTDFFRKYFEIGLPYENYVLTGSPAQKERWLKGSSFIKLSKEQFHLLTSFKRTMNIIVLTGIWCGDCARQGPMLREIEKAAPCMHFRYVESHNHPELVDELRIQGGSRVPVVVTLSEEFWEINRFGDRTLSAYRRKVAHELAPSCESGIWGSIADEFAQEVSDWISHFERLQLLLRTSPHLRKKYGD